MVGRGNLADRGRPIRATGAETSSDFSGDDIPMLGHARKVCKVLDAKAKGMIAERNRNAGTPRT
jgi:hypothetical protein